MNEMQAILGEKGYCWLLAGLISVRHSQQPPTSVSGHLGGVSTTYSGHISLRLIKNVKNAVSAEIVVSHCRLYPSTPPCSLT